MNRSKTLTANIDSFKEKTIEEFKAKEEAAKLASSKPTDPPISGISLDDLLGKHLLLLYRETRSLMMESANGEKLSKESAQCLRDNLKLLLELKMREKDILEDLSDEELEKAANVNSQSSTKSD